jgi:hypothetical protein
MLNINVEPATYADGIPISATTVRTALQSGDFETFKNSYPGIDPDKIQQCWDLLHLKYESIFTTNWWTKVLAEDIADVVEAYDRGQTIEREDLAKLEPVIDGFFKQYKIDVDFQGKYTHFLDRLNDPRNESPIYTDELQNFFEDLADEYGSAIANQLSANKTTGIGSDYQFDVPMHMPFRLQWNALTNMIELIPKTIKKQRNTWKQNDPNDVIYKIESLMREGRHRIECNNCTHSWPTKTGGKDLYVCHECRHDNNPALKESKILTEGGAAGHMAHPWDDHGLTFNDMKEIVSRGLSGRLDIEAPTTEKTDGQNIQVTWKNGQPGFARNKGTVINPLTPEQLVADFERKYQQSVDQNGVQGSEGYALVVEAYRTCANDLTESLNKINPSQLQQIFKDGRVFANMEIIYPATKNVISYDKAHLQFHNLVEYDEKGNVVLTDLAGGKFMQSIIEDANAHMQNTFSFIPPQQIKLGRVDNFEDQQAAFINEIDQLKNQYGLKETDLISEYHKAWWKNVIETKAKSVGYQIPENILTTLIYRWAFADKSTNISALKKQIDNPEFVNWVDAFDKKDFKMYLKQNLEPFESIFLKLGVIVLQNATNFLTANPSKAVQDIKSDLSKLIKDLQIKNDPSTMQQLQFQLKRIEKLGGFDAIVPAEGIVFVYDGNTYKLTGAFAPVNQILGTLKYAR